MITGTKGRGAKTNLTSLQVLDSRGIPTVCAVLRTKNGLFTATVPSGTSSGKNEAIELRDSRKAFNGKGVSKAVQNVQKVAKSLPENFYVDQAKLDTTLLTLDNTANKQRLGANALLAISLVASKAAAAENNEPLFAYFNRIANTKSQIPIPFSVVIDGGRHAGNDLRFQEFMLVPTGFSSFEKCTQAIVETYVELRRLLYKKFGVTATNVGQEGGFAAPLSKTTAALDLLETATHNAGYGNKIKIALDCAASEFYNSKTNTYNYEGKNISAEKLSEVYYALIEDYPIISIEDPFHQEDFTTFSSFTKNCKITVVGDDLLTTNPTRIIKGILNNSCNALLLKPNQIGTITETLEAAELARNAGWKVIASHRAGDSEDTFLAHLAVGLGCEAAKIGAPCRGERTSKYNKLLFIERFHKLKLAKWV